MPMGYTLWFWLLQEPYIFIFLIADVIFCRKSSDLCGKVIVLSVIPLLNYFKNTQIINIYTYNF